MQLTRHTDYALRTLVFLGLRQGGACTVRDIASYYRISHHHLVKVVRRLADAGFVSARRGRGGGVALVEDAHAINLADVIRCVEPELALVECQRANAPRCRIEGACPLQGILGGAVERFLGELARHSLADVLRPMAKVLTPESLVRPARRPRGALARSTGMRQV
jgi:Rrf2 family nitric oxide-sensitive transcriptional repressor